jgi:pimeloyl-ACP methyl ester carboxylesterase
VSTHKLVHIGKRSGGDRPAAGSLAFTHWSSLQAELIRHADLHIVPFAGHQVMQEQPDEVNAILAGLLGVGTRDGAPPT